MIGVDGELRQDRWQQEGQNRSKIEIVANNLQLLGGSQGDKSNFRSAASGEASSEEQSYASSKDDGFTDDIPF
jgi:single-strand DNA-binding protein